jgi:hypothetical protein
MSLCTEQALCAGRERSHHFLPQGCQMQYFKNKNPNLGKFWRVLKWNLLVYFTAI